MAKPLSDDEMLARMQAAKAPAKPLSDDEMMAHMQNQLPGQPGVQAIGTDGPAPEPEGIVGKTVSTIGKGVGAVGKAFDVLRGTTTGPLLAAGLQAATGKDVFRPGEMVDAINPTNLKKFPGANELYARAGVPEGGKLSDVAKSPLSVVPGRLADMFSQMPALQYKEHTGSNPWYQPEKGGMLDPTIRGAGGLATDIAIDPATWLSVGAAGLRRTAMEGDAVKQALQNAPKGIVADTASKIAAPAQSLLDMGTSPIEAATKALTDKFPVVGNAAVNLSQAPSNALAAMGKKFYNGFLMPVENEGAKYSKAEVGDDIYKAGIKTPFGLDKKLADKTGVIMDARDSILNKAGDAGAQVSMADSMEPIRQQIAKMRATRDPQTQAIADTMENKMNEYLQLEKGTPAVAPQTSSVNTGILDAQGNPITRSEVTPGVDAVPGMKVPPKLASGYKTSLYNALPAGTFNDTVNTPLGGELRATLARGLKNATENSVASTLGPEAGQSVQNLNDTAGKFLSTRKAQLRVSNQADRVASDIGNITGTDANLVPLSMMNHGGAEEGLTALALRKAMQTLRLGAMPTGYGMRKAAEGELTGPALDVFLRQQMIQKANTNQGDRQ